MARRSHHYNVLQTETYVVSRRRTLPLRSLTGPRNGCQNFGHSPVQLLQSFDAISTQLHSVDLQGATATYKTIVSATVGLRVGKSSGSMETHAQGHICRFATLCDSHLQMSRHILNLCYIPEPALQVCRLEPPFFCVAILSLSDARSSKSYQELRSHIAISGEQATVTFNLVEKPFHFNAVLNNFHAELARVTSQRTPSSPPESREVCN
ncbi:Tryptophan synthase beta subunit-like PLP-dependent enzyme [Mycena indigotica]|uniref:Tryptophan synthase beta subunit-like PLP-dependent enzyme n=1 Tax=Mycena indigotica TaxID=2126181 RepID=A0A8H6VWW2_9AGAR|nr:Tryptophan synthase beta subunit-like PLP-dependent enzyme [Mycena indigotica]KAF7297044.1 Tryptophan synthase beta subunit-like PLP-dependent enzyme [Mycena indigotica]